MNRRGWSLLLVGMLIGCAPAPLRAQPGAQVGVDTRVATPPLNTVTGEQLYRAPGPGALLVHTDRPAFVTSLFVPATGGISVLNVGPVGADETVSVPVPGAVGFTQVYTVASLTPLDLSAAQGAPSLDAAARVVQAATQGQAAGAYTVSTTTYTVARFGRLRVEASEPGAEVRVNGRLIGKAPLLVDVPEASILVSVSEDGFTTVSERVNIQPDSVAVVRASLQLSTGTLHVSSDVPAYVVVGGQTVGQTGGGLNVAVRPGSVGVNVVPLDTALKAQNLLVRVTARQTTTIACQVSAGEYGCRTR